MDLKAGDRHFEGYDAVYFIAGITSIGTPEDVYRRISYDIPTHFADIMPSKEQMTYIYLSGMGTDPNGIQWWMPIKGATEQYINTLGFKHAFAYRPALMRWAKGQRGTKMQRMQYAYLYFFVCRKPFPHDTHGYLSRFVLRVTEYAGRDAAESNTCQSMLCSHIQTVTVTSG